MASRLDEAEWMADCLKPRMDSLAAADADECERRPLPARNSMGLNLGASRAAYSRTLREEGPDKEPPAEKEAPSSVTYRKVRVP